MINRARFPLISSMHGTLGQGRASLDQVTLFRGWTRLTTDGFGDIKGEAHEGFFAGDTLFLTQFRVSVRGKPLQHTFSAQTSAFEWCGLFLEPGTVDEGNIEAGAIPSGSTEVRILREILDDWRESILVRNYSRKPKELELALDLVCPIADIQFEEEMKIDPLEQAQGVAPRVSWNDDLPALRYERDFGKRRRAPTTEFGRLGTAARVSGPRDGEAVTRALDITMSMESSPGVRRRVHVAEGAFSRIVIHLSIPGSGTAELKLRFEPESDGRKLKERDGARVQGGRAIPKDRPGSSFPRTKIKTGNATLNLLLGQAQTDLDALALPLPPLGSMESSVSVGSLISAGVPRYVGLFSRDILTAAWQSALLSPQYMESAVSALELFKGTRRDAWRDEEPDQLPHEVRLNPRAELGDTNREVYYGDVVSTNFWLVTLATAYLWGGDRELLFRHRETIESCTRWIDRRLRQDGGFIFYEAGTPDGNRHHAWKDSGDAIVDEHGRVAAGKLATCEVQGFCFLALLASAEMALGMGEFGRAWERFRQATELKQRFNRAFWMEDPGFYCVAIDASGRKIGSITSNPGHCLGCGIVAKDRIPSVVARLWSEDLFSGWGIRTLSSQNPAYDPFSYHRGSVWPVENATIAGGFRLCGYDEHAARLIEAQFGAATVFPQFRLPELLSGHARGDEYPIPAIYKDANLLQAWSVSAVLFNVQTLLGLRPVAPLRTLFIKPYLPEWLPWLVLEDLRVGGASVSLRFWRDAKGVSRWEVLKKEGTLHVIEQEAELDPDATLFSRVVDVFRSGRAAA